MCKYDGMTEGQVLSLQGNADLVHEVRDRLATYVDGDPMLSVHDLLTGEPDDLLVPLVEYLNRLACLGGVGMTTPRDACRHPETERLSQCCGAPEHGDVEGFCSTCKD